MVTDPDQRPARNESLRMASRCAPTRFESGGWAASERPNEVINAAASSVVERNGGRPKVEIRVFIRELPGSISQNQSALIRRACQENSSPRSFEPQDYATFGQSSPLKSCAARQDAGNEMWQATGCDCRYENPGKNTPGTHAHACACVQIEGYVFSRSRRWPV